MEHVQRPGLPGQQESAELQVLDRLIMARDSGTEGSGLGSRFDADKVQDTEDGPLPEEELQLGVKAAAADPARTNLEADDPDEKTKAVADLGADEDHSGACQKSKAVDDGDESGADESVSRDVRVLAHLQRPLDRWPHRFHDEAGGDEQPRQVRHDVLRLTGHLVADVLGLVEPVVVVVHLVAGLVLFNQDLRRGNDFDLFENGRYEK